MQAAGKSDESVITATLSTHSSSEQTQPAHCGQLLVRLMPSCFHMDYLDKVDTKYNTDTYVIYQHLSLCYEDGE